MTLFGAFSSVTVSAPQAAANSPGELQMVSKGVFTLGLGQSIDLTDRGILLHFVAYGGEKGQPVRNVTVSINGRADRVNIGYRFDLKRGTATEDFVSDMRICFLDVVSAVAPQGAPESATFRLLCE